MMKSGVRVRGREGKRKEFFAAQFLMLFLKAFPPPLLTRVILSPLPP
jgi:hypothetical protein